MARRPRRGRVLLTAGVGCAVLLAAGPSLARAVRAELTHMLASGISGSITFKMVDQGRTTNNVTTGVVGTGTIAGRLSLEAQVAAALIGAVKGVPVAAVAHGGTYVERYDIDARGVSDGLIVIRFTAAGVGSLCLHYTVAPGKFDPNKADYIPTTTAFATVGGTGSIAAVHARGTLTQGEITGSTIEQILAHGTVSTLAKGPAAAFSPACTAVAKLAH